MKVLRRFQSLSPAERRLALAALLTVLAVRCALWLLPSRMIVRKIRQRAPATSGGVVAALRVSAIVRAVEFVSARVPGASSLTQAVSAWLLLRRYGYASELCVAVARGSRGRPRAHGWLKRQGRVVLGGTTDAHSPLPEFYGARQISRPGSS